MYIHNLIEENLSKLNLYDKNGYFIEYSRLENEYFIIKNHLLEKYNEGDIVAIRLDKDYKYLLTILACMSIGITYIPLNIEWPNERIKQIEELSGCSILNEDDIEFDKFISLNPIVKYNNEVLYIIFTSGSTGVPKGVKIKRTGYENFLIWIDSYFKNINEEDKMLLTTDFTFDISLVDISLFLTKRLSLYISNFGNNIFKMLFELEKYKITTHSTVPYNYSMLMHENVYSKGDISHLKHIMIGGARFPYNLYYSFKEKLSLCNIYNFYGPTEATIYCSIHKLSYKERFELHKNNISIGKPLLNNYFKIYDGELLIRGEQIMIDYLNNPEKTAEAFISIDNKLYYKSGDLVFQNSENNYFVVGRKDDTIKVVGYRVNLSDIDSYILNIEYINNVATIAIDNEEGENDLISYIILNNKNIDVKKIRTDLKKIMPTYQIAKYIKVVETFPLNNSGKVCKHTLKQMFLDKNNNKNKKM
jgi:acyl-coenzyme A synthetase/AMP-(fatty) acid ligase